MGCGKSSVGRRLSELLCCSFIDLDDVIEEREGRSIPEIFATEGEATFRQMELKALEHVINNGGMERVWKQSLPSHSAMGPSLCGQRGSTVSETPPNLHHAEVNHQVIAMCDATCQSADYERPSLVLALGGGTVMTAECAEIVHSDTLCIYLRASVETLLEHLSGQADNRPLLNTHDCHSERAKRVEESALRDRITDLMAKRSDTYEKTAHIVIDTDGKSIEAVASEIISKLG